jgi:tetratricopeptide (TPR) repeat protein
MLVRQWSDNSLELAIGAHRAGRAAEARRHYEDVLRFRPDDAKALHYYGVLRHALGDTQTAVLLIRRSLRQTRTDSQAWLNLGQILLEQERLDDALDAFRNAARFDCDLADAWYSIGICQQRLGDPVAAVSAFDRALALCPERVPWLYQRAIARRESGNLRGAQRDFSAGFGLRPNCTMLYERLGAPLP